MIIIRSVILVSCILAVVTAGAVRSSPEGKKTDVTLLTSNLLKAASDSSSPALLRKSNKTVETVYTKMEKEKSIELAHEKEMDQVYRSRIETVNKKFNATVQKEKKKRSETKEEARKAAGLDANGDPIDNQVEEDSSAETKKKEKGLSLFSKSSSKVGPDQPEEDSDSDDSDDDSR